PFWPREPAWLHSRVDPCRLCPRTHCFHCNLVVRIKLCLRARACSPNHKFSGGCVMTVERDPRTIPNLVTDLVEQLSTLVRTESQLLRTELKENVGRAGNGVMEIAAGAMLLLAALIVLLQALIAGLVKAGLEAGWAALIVGVIVAVIGAILVKRGTSNMSPSEIAPSRTAAQLRKDGQLAREQAP